MNILLVQPIGYLGIGGAQIANRALLEGLVERGHTCHAIVSTFNFGPDATAQVHTELAARQLPVLVSTPESIVFAYKGVEVHVILDLFQMLHYVMQHMREFEPAWTLVSDDISLTLLRGGLEVSPRVVYVAHGPTILPFGPGSFMEDPAKTALLGQAAGIITVSHYMQERIRRWGKLESTVIHFPSYGSGPFPYYGRFEQGFVTMTNPSAAKGISIFVALAQQLPDIPFAVVPSWGTTSADRAILAQLPNVHVLDPTDHIDDIFAHTRVQLVPALGNESFGQIVVEAMLRGIPVLASDVGGLPEAKLGVDYTLPVNPIQQYEPAFDERSIPIPIIPDQSDLIAIWRETLQSLLADHERYDRLSRASREAALAFVAGLSVVPFETYLEGLEPKAHPIQPAPPQRSAPAVAPGDLDAQLQHLSPETRTLLAFRLSEQLGDRSAAQRSAATPAVPQPQQPRPNLPTPYVAPRNAIEQIVVDICQALLTIAPIGIHDDFAALGGNLMLVMSAIERLREILHVEVPVETFFAPDLTPAALAAAVERLLITQADPQAVTMALQSLDV